MIGSCVSRAEALTEGNWELRENRWHFVVGNKAYLFSLIYIPFAPMSTSVRHPRLLIYPPWSVHPVSLSQFGHRSIFGRIYRLQLCSPGAIRRKWTLKLIENRTFDDNSRTNNIFRRCFGFNFVSLPWRMAWYDKIFLVFVFQYRSGRDGPDVSEPRDCGSRRRGAPPSLVQQWWRKRRPHEIVSTHAPSSFFFIYTYHSRATISCHQCNRQLTFNLWIMPFFDKLMMRRGSTDSQMKFVPTDQAYIPRA